MSELELLRGAYNELKVALSTRIDTYENLLGLLVPPLRFLGLLPANEFTNYRDQTWASFSSDDREIFVQRYLASTQIVLLQHVYVDWAEQLRDNAAFDQLFRSWFCPLTGSSLSEEETTAHLIVSQSSLLAAITARNQEASTSSKQDLHSLAFEFVCQTLHDLRAQLPVKRPFFHTHKSEKPSPKEQLLWTSCLQSYFATPAKLSNAQSRIAHSQTLPEELSWTMYMQTLANQTEDLLEDVARLLKHHSFARPLSDILGKFARSGFCNSVSSSSISLFSILWPRLLLQLDPETSSPLATLWRSVLHESDSRDLLTLEANHLAVLMQPNDCLDISAITIWDSEYVTSSKIRSLASLLAQMYGTMDRSDVCLARTVIKRLMLEREGWSLLWARLVACWAATSSKGNVSNIAGLDWLIAETLQLWSLAKIIEQASLDYHMYLTTILLLSVRHLPKAHPSISALSTSPLFLSAIQAHLGSLRRQVRLLGMLAAEIVSGQASQPDTELKPLDFGADIWDQKGDAEDACRRLRELLDRKMDIHFPAFILEVKPSADEFPDPEIPELVMRTGYTSPRAAPKTSGVQRGFSSSTSSTTKLSKPKIQVIDSSTLNDGDDDEDDLVPFALPEDQPQLTEEVLEDPTLYTPQKTKVRPPVYISDLTDMLRASEDAEKLEMALKEGATVIRKKSGWGLELEEHAVDLAFALLCLQNNFELEDFDRRRQEAMTALIVAVPKKVAPMLIEQFFLHQYSLMQRMSVLAGLTYASQELAGHTALPAGRQMTPFPSKRLPDRLHERLAPAEAAGMSHSTSLIDNASGKLIEDTLAATRGAAQERLPEANRSALLTLKTSPVQPRGKQSRAIPTVSIYPQIAAEYFLMPFINQLWAYLNDISSGRIAAQDQRAESAGPVLEPVSLSRIFACLCVLTDSARHSPHFLHVLCPETLELALALQSLLQDAQVLANQLNLILICLQAASSIDECRALKLSSPDILSRIETYTGKIWNEVSQEGNKVDSAARACAAILLILDEI